MFAWLHDFHMLLFGRDDDVDALREDINRWMKHDSFNSIKNNVHSHKAKWLIVINLSIIQNPHENKRKGK